MARLILHARYFAPNAKKREGRLSYLVKYYGTREGVEKPQAEAWKQKPATENQREMIERMLDDIPELKETHEWEDYVQDPSQGNASEVITWAAERQMQTGKPDIYLKYIAERPRVEKIGDHGLFSQTDGVIDLNEVAKTISTHPGNVWTFVFSLRREDAERLSYNNAAAWTTLCRAKSAEVAKAMKIPYEDFYWYAAFHNESHHPHIHMVAYSTGREGHLTRYGIDDIKSQFAATIFELDLTAIYEQQTQYRNELRQMAKDYMQKLRDLPQAAGELQHLLPILEEIHRRLPSKGKIKYGYMPKDVKNLVDEAVNRLEKHPKVAELYDLWYKQKCAITATYTTNFPPKQPLSENETFRDIKNAVLQAAKEVGEGLGYSVGQTMDGQDATWGPEWAEVFMGHDENYNEVNKSENGFFQGNQELEKTIARIEREHARPEMMPTAYEATAGPSFRSVESFLYRVSKVFEDKRPIGDRGQAMDRKMYVREVEKKQEMGLK